MAWKVERVSRPVWHCPGLTRNGPGDPFYMGRRMHEDLSTLLSGEIREIKSHLCKSVFFFRRSRPLQPQVDGICVPIWLDHEWHEFSRMGGRAGRLRA